MKVKELLANFRCLKKVSFLLDDNKIEEIDCTAHRSYLDIRKHHDETVLRVFAMAEDEIRIDSK